MIVDPRNAFQLSQERMARQHVAEMQKALNLAAALWRQDPDNEGLRRALMAAIDDFSECQSDSM